MKKSLKINELEINPKEFDRIFNSLDDEKTKTKSFQEEIGNIFNYGVVRQVEKFF